MSEKRRALADRLRRAAPMLEPVRGILPAWIAEVCLQAAEALSAPREQGIEEAAKVVERIKHSIDYRLNNALCEMKPGYDDSITGFNEAWDIVRERFAEEIRSLSSPRADVARKERADG